MAELVLTGVGDDVVKALKTRAALRGQSLEDVVRDIVAEAAPLSADERIAVAERIAGWQLKPIETSSADVVRHIRDER